MLHKAKLIIDPAEQKNLNALKLQVNKLYASQQIFQVSLKTLELSRRFNALYSKINSGEDYSRADLCNLLSIAKYLEENLLREQLN